MVKVINLSVIQLSVLAKLAQQAHELASSLSLYLVLSKYLSQ